MNSITASRFINYLPKICILQPLLLAPPSHSPFLPSRVSWILIQLSATQFNTSPSPGPATISKYVNFRLEFLQNAFLWSSFWLLLYFVILFPTWLRSALTLIAFRTLLCIATPPVPCPPHLRWQVFGTLVVLIRLIRTYILWVESFVSYSRINNRKKDMHRSISFLSNSLSLALPLTPCSSSYSGPDPSWAQWAAAYCSCSPTKRPSTTECWTREAGAAEAATSRRNPFRRDSSPCPVGASSSGTRGAGA